MRSDFKNDMEEKICIYPYESPFGNNSRGIAMCEERDWNFQLKSFKEWSEFELDIYLYFSLFGKRQ